MEIGAGQAEGAKKALEDHGFVEVATKRDYGRIERVVSGVHARSC
jgi:methylase of polypeptide subunit release factors